MIVFETQNSIYSVEVEKGLFKITKTVEKNSRSTYNAVGVPRYATYMSISIGGGAHFSMDGDASWTTSTVLRVL